MTRMKKVLGVVTALAFATTQPATAQDKVTLKFTFPFGMNHQLWTEAGKNFTEAVTEQTGGAIEWELYPSGQLGSDYLSLLDNGIADVAMVVPSYIPEKFPLSSVSELPGYWTTPCEGLKLFWNIVQPGAPLHEQEFTPNKLHLLFVTVSPAYRVFTTKKPIATPEDMAGLKLRAIGMAQIMTAEALGAVPISVTSAEMYDALSRGTMDGVWYATVGMGPYELQNIIKYGTNGILIGGPMVAWTMSDQAWNKLPKETQDILSAVGEKTQQDFCAWYGAFETSTTEKYVEENGMQLIEFSAADVERMKATLATVPGEWARVMDEQGKGGTEMLKLYEAGSQ